MADVNVYRDGTVYVRAEKCDHCLFSPNRLVPPQRAAELHRATNTAGPFVCHRHQVSDEPESICAGWWVRFSDDCLPTLLAKRIGIVEWVHGE